MDNKQLKELFEKELNNSNRSLLEKNVISILLNNFDSDYLISNMIEIAINGLNSFNISGLVINKDIKKFFINNYKDILNLYNYSVKEAGFKFLEKINYYNLTYFTIEETIQNFLYEFDIEFI